MVEYSSWMRHSKKIGPEDVETSTKFVINLQLNVKEALDLKVEEALCCLTTSPSYILMAGFNLLTAVEQNVLQQQVEHTV